MEKDNIQDWLVKTGRKMVQDNGPEALTVRKLAEASGCSVGMIYNQFANMENFILIQNFLTLDDLEKNFRKIEKTGNPYQDINVFLQTFVDFVISNKNLWSMLHNFHLNNNSRTFSFFYLRKVVQIVGNVGEMVRRIVPDMEIPERLLSAQILWLTLFSLSSFLAKDTLDSFSKVNKKMICQVLLNTYIAGLTVLENKK
ncbi:MAG: TetR/AcrR family transcriptional regulator [Alphaproteobacteria bacterium]|nr:TetR/AcrR family transcriptional regulator [Alphaproteobacteria bacterium]